MRISSMRPCCEPCQYGKRNESKGQGENEAAHLGAATHGILEPLATGTENGLMSAPLSVTADNLDIGEVARTEKPEENEQ